jgi:hypothetical protein
MDKVFILIQGSASLLFLQLFNADLLPAADFGIKLVVAGFTCYALYRQTKNKK